MRRPAFLLMLAIFLVTVACGQPSPSPTLDVEATVQAAIAATGTARPRGAPSSAPPPSSTPPPGRTATPTPTPIPATAPPLVLPTATPRLFQPPTATPGGEPTAAPPQPTAPAPSDADMENFEEALAGRDPFAPPSPDQPAEPAAADQVGNPFVYLFPELAQAAAPDWLDEGVRVTYYGQSANITQVPWEESSGSAGYLQCDLIALDEEAAVSSIKFLVDLGQSTLIPTVVLPGLGLPGAGDYWLHPDALERAEGVAGDDLVVIRGPAEIAGETYQAVRFEYRTEEALYVWMFDQASGVLLFYRHEIQTAGDTHKQLTDLTLVQQRQLQLPWQARSGPAWVDEVNALQYEGEITSYVMGSPAGSVPYEVVAETAHNRPRWSAYLFSDYLDGRKNSTTWRLTGVAQPFDALWLSPEALDALEDGQVLDRDPVTEAEISVARRRDGTIVLAESNRAYRTDLIYGGDDGLLYALIQEIHNGASTTVVELELTAWE